MKNLGRVLMLMPLAFLLMIYMDSGLLGVAMFMLYVVATFFMIIGPIIGAMIISWWE